MVADFKYTKRDLARIGFSCIQFNLKKTARRISSYYDDILKPSGLKATQFSVLIVVAMEEASSIAGVSRLVDVDRTTLQRSFDILEREGLISINKEPKGNIRNVSITNKGKKKLDSAIGLWQIAQASITKKLGAEKIKTLLKFLSETRRVKFVD
jgi:DNA-binding MarR family transcriptional regulator